MLRRTFLGLCGLCWWLPKVAKAGDKASSSQNSEPYQYVFERGNGVWWMCQLTESPLSLFRPTATQDRFLRAMARGDWDECGAHGLSRSGTTVAMAVWFASMVLDQPVIMRNGDRLHMRPRRWAGQELTCWAVGYDCRHIGKVMYRALFETGLFQIIRGENGWEIYRPDNPEHRHRKADRIPAPPLISGRDIIPVSWSWESRKDFVPRSVRMKGDGTKIVFHQSTRDIPAGDPIHAVWIDQKLSRDADYAELLIRTVDHDGYVVWSYNRNSDSPSFASLCERATRSNSAIVHRFNVSQG